VPEHTLTVSVELSFDETVATVRLGDRTPIVSGVLGVDREKDQVQRIYLDRYVHKSVRGYAFQQWKPTGAVSTILERM
jgi:6,7-dimethyl-8-ribityllumazine synthase